MLYSALSEGHTDTRGRGHGQRAAPPSLSPKAHKERRGHSKGSGKCHGAALTLGITNATLCTDLTQRDDFLDREIQTHVLTKPTCTHPQQLSHGTQEVETT